MRWLTRHPRILTFLAVACLPGAAFANSGDADPTFGSGGITLIDFTPLSGAPGSVGTAATAVDDQGRVWVAASVQGTAEGLGLARLKRDGTRDGSFGTLGLIYVGTTNAIDVFGLRVGPDGKAYLGYADRPAYMGNSNDLTWRVCRLAEDGSFDSGFYGTGCASFLAPYPYFHTHGFLAYNQGTFPVDMQVSPSDGSVWVLGEHSDADKVPPVNDVAIVAVEQGNAGIAMSELPRSGHVYVPTRGAFNSDGTFFFTGIDFSSGASTSYAVLEYVTRFGTLFTPYPIDTPLATPFGASTQNNGRCIAVDPVTGAVHIGISGSGSQWAAIDTITTNYGYVDGSYVGQGTSVFTPATLANESFAMNDCALAADGSFNLAGKWHAPDPSAADTYTDAAIVQRLDAHGAGDATFDGNTPGTVPTLEAALGTGAVADYVRTSTASVRGDAATSITAWHGPLVVGVTSARLDSAGNDVAVMRLLTDDIFNAGFER